MLEILDLKVSYGAIKALDGVSLSVPRGAIVALFLQQRVSPGDGLKCLFAIRFRSSIGSFHFHILRRGLQEPRSHGSTPMVHAFKEIVFERFVALKDEKVFGARKHI